MFLNQLNLPHQETHIFLLVRPNDFDKIGHVNNAVTLEYFETGRVDWLIRNQLDTISKVVPVVSRCEVDYRSEITVREIKVSTKLLEVGAYSAKFKQRIFVDSNVSVEAVVQVGFIDYLQRTIVETEKFFAREEIGDVTVNP